MSKFDFIWKVTVFGGVVGLLIWVISLANSANPGALMLVGGLVATALIIIGARIGLWFVKVSAEREERQFVNNAKENAMIMQQQARAMQEMFKAQNTQNKALGQQTPPQAADGFPALLPPDVVEGQFTITGFDEQETTNDVH